MNTATTEGTSHPEAVATPGARSWSICPSDVLERYLPLRELCVIDEAKAEMRGYRPPIRQLYREPPYEETQTEKAKTPSRKRGRPAIFTPEERAAYIRTASVMRPGLFRKQKQLHQEEITRIRAEHEAQLSAIRNELDIALNALARVNALVGAPLVCKS